MKVEAKREVSEPKFEPIKVTLTLETQEEACALYSIFNHAAICDGIRGALNDYAIRTALDGYLCADDTDAAFEKLNKPIKAWK